MKLTNEQIEKILEGATKDSTHVDSLGFYHNNDGRDLSDLREILELRQEVERLKEACGSTKLQLKNTIKLLRANNRKLERGKETNQEYFESMLTKFITDTTETGQFGWSDCQWLDDWKYEWLESLSENELREQDDE